MIRSPTHMEDYSISPGRTIKIENGIQIQLDGLSTNVSIAAIDEINFEMGKTQTEIDEVDTTIMELKEKKIQLLAKFESLKNEKCLRKSAQIAKKDWEADTFTWSSNVKDALNKVFKLKDFRAQQLKAINAVLSKSDVLLLAPTGGGKSLCFQLPAMISKGVTVVISPLVALMQDQVWSLQKLGIEAELLCSTISRSDCSRIYNYLSNKSEKCKLRLLYVTPERLAKSKRFMSALQKCYHSNKLDMFAVDEVHCCSQWGHDFRPDYKYLFSLKTMFPDVPILGVTATATTKIIVDVQKMLNIRECLVLKAPFNRPNLYYHVINKPTEKSEVLKILSKLLMKRYAGMSGIIYTFSIKDAEDITAGLVNQGIKVCAYHATLDAERRTKIHKKWLSGEIQAVVATIAFGMGIDKPDVRFVIHHTISKSIENFYQESGRAGRDGKRAECILLYRFGDMARITGMMFTERTGLKNAYSMINYCINGTKCRRDLLSEHFTEVWQESDCNEMCDRCLNKDRIVPPRIDIKEHCFDLYKIIDYAANKDVKLTGTMLIDSWYKKSSSNVPGIETPNFERLFAEQIVVYLIIENYLKEDFHFTAYSKISYLVRGEKKPNKDVALHFNGARTYSLPKSRNLWSDDISDVEIISDVNESFASTQTNRKRSVRSVMRNETEIDQHKTNHPSSKKSRHSSRNSSSSSKQLLEKASIERISTCVSRMVTEIVREETKRTRLYSERSENYSELDDVVDISVNDDVIVLD